MKIMNLLFEKLAVLLAQTDTLSLESGVEEDSLRASLSLIPRPESALAAFVDAQAPLPPGALRLAAPPDSFGATLSLRLETVAPALVALAREMLIESGDSAPPAALEAIWRMVKRASGVFAWQIADEPEAPAVERIYAAAADGDGAALAADFDEMIRSVSHSFKPADDQGVRSMDASGAWAAGACAMAYKPWEGGVLFIFGPFAPEDAAALLARTRTASAPDAAALGEFHMRVAGEPPPPGYSVGVLRKEGGTLRLEAAIHSSFAKAFRRSVERAGHGADTQRR